MREPTGHEADGHDSHLSRLPAGFPARRAGTSRIGAAVRAHEVRAGI